MKQLTFLIAILAPISVTFASDETISTKDLAIIIEDSTGLDQRAAKDRIEEVFFAIESALLTGKSVQIRSFGTFYLQSRQARLARNPGTGKKVKVPPRKYPRFRSSEVLKKLINSPTSSSRQ